MFDSLYPGMVWSDHRHHWPHAQHSQFVNAGAIRWHVQIAGQGPCLLLLHGTGSGNFSWRGLLPLLAPHFTVVSPDLPGHVFTSRGVGDALSLQGMSHGLSALLGQLQLQPQVMVGHSAGAAIAAQMALTQAPLADTTLIGLNPAWLPLPGLASWLFGPAAKLAQLNPLSAWATAKMAQQPGAVSRWLERTGSTLDPAGIDLYTRVLSDPGHVHGVLSMMAAWRLKPLAAHLHALRNPVLMAIGSQDQTVPPALAHEARRLLPQAALVKQSGLGHLAHEQDPQGTAEHIVRWCVDTGVIAPTPPAS